MTDKHPVSQGIEFGIHDSVNTPLWMRRLTDGRCLVLGVLRECPLPEGVNDAVVDTTLVPQHGRDATGEGKGKTFIDIIEGGWKR